MPVAYESDGGTVFCNAANNNAVTVALPATRPVGSVLLFVAWCRLITAAAPAPSGYTLLNTFTSGTASGGRIWLYAKEVVGGETAPSVTPAGATGTSGDIWGACIFCYSGVDLSGGISAILDGTPTTTDAAGTTTCTYPALTISNSASMIVRFLARFRDAADTFTFTSTWNEREDLGTTTRTGGQFHLQDKLATSSGSQASVTVAPSNTTSARYLAVTAALKPIVPTQTSVARLSLATGGEPATRTAHSIKVRARVTSGAGRIRAALYEGATNRSGDLESSALTTSLANYTLAIPDASAANITDYSDLEIRLWGYAVGGGAIVVEVDQIWLETPEAEVTLTAVGSSLELPYKMTGAVGASLALPYDVEGEVVPSQTTVARLSLAAGSTPATRTAHSIKVRARVTSGAGTIRAALYEGSTNRSGDLESNALTTSLNTYTLAIPDASAANIGSYGDLELRVWGYATAGGAIVVEIDQIWLETPASGVVAVGASLAQPYTVRQAIGASLAMPSAVKVQVAQSLAVPYTVRQAVGQPLALPYVVRQAIGASAAFPYAVKQAISRSVALPYAVKQTVGQSLAQPYIVKVAIGGSVALPYTAKQIAARSIALPYVVSGRIGQGIALPYVVKQAVARSIALPYTVIGRIGQSVALPAIVRELVGSSVALPATVRQLVGRSVALPYNVAEGTLTAVGASLATPYAVRAHVGASLAQPWGIRTLVTRSLATPYVVKQAIGRSVAQPYIVVGRVGVSLAQPWIVRQAIGRSLAQPYIVVARVGASLAQPWTVRQLASRSLATPYIVRQAIGASLAQPWTVKQLATSSLAQPYAVRQIAGQSLALPSAIRILINRSLALPYALRQNVSQPLALPYGIKVTVGQSLAIPYVVRQAIGRSVALPYAISTDVIGDNILVSGGGSAIVQGRKNASRSVTASGGGSAIVQGTKSSSRTVVVSDGGDVVIQGAKGARRAVVTSGGGAALVQTVKGAIRTIVASGGGAALAQGRKGALRTLIISGGGVVTASGTQATTKTGTATVVGGGSAIATGRKDASSIVFVQGGGAAIAAGSAGAATVIVVSGGGLATTTGFKGASATVLVLGGGTAIAIGQRASPTILNTAAALYYGSQPVTAVWLGGALIWPPAFSPPDLANLTVWLDASQLPLGSVGSSLTDLSGNGNNGTIVGSPSPVIVAGPRPLPVMRITFNQGRVRGVSNGLTPIGSGQRLNYTIVYVSRVIGPASGRVFTAVFPPENFLVGFHSGMDGMYDQGWVKMTVAYPPLPTPWRLYSATGIHSAGTYTVSFFIDGIFQASSNTGGGTGVRTTRWLATTQSVRRRRPTARSPRSSSTTASFPIRSASRSRHTCKRSGRSSSRAPLMLTISTSAIARLRAISSSGSPCSAIMRTASRDASSAEGAAISQTEPSPAVTAIARQCGWRRNGGDGPAEKRDPVAVPLRQQRERGGEMTGRDLRLADVERDEETIVGRLRIAEHSHRSREIVIEQDLPIGGLERVQVRRTHGGALTRRCHQPQQWHRFLLSIRPDTPGRPDSRRSEPPARGRCARVR